MRSLVSTALVLAGVLVVFGASSLAHHSTPPYWRTNDTIEIEGVVKQMKIINPHSELIVSVDNAAGVAEDWIGVSGTGNNMIKAGWTNETLPAGARVKVVGAPPRREGARGILIRQIILENGRVLTSGNID